MISVPSCGKEGHVRGQDKEGDTQRKEPYLGHGCEQWLRFAVGIVIVAVAAAVEELVELGIARLDIVLLQVAVGRRAL